MSNIEKVKDLIEQAEDYRARNIVFDNKRKSWLTPEEQRENTNAMLEVIDILSKYNEK